MAETLSQIIKKMFKEVSDIRRYDVSTSSDNDLKDMKREVLQERTSDLYQRYKGRLKGTPEIKYLDDLLKMYSTKENPIFYEALGFLDLSVRTSSYLIQNNIEYIGELVQCTEEELLEMKDFGKTNLAEIERKLDANNLSLGQDTYFKRPLL